MVTRGLSVAQAGRGTLRRAAGLRARTAGCGRRPRRPAPRHGCAARTEERRASGPRGLLHRVERLPAGSDGVAADDGPALVRLDAQADVPVAVPRRERPLHAGRELAGIAGEPLQREQLEQAADQHPVGRCASSSCTATGVISEAHPPAWSRWACVSTRRSTSAAESPRASSARSTGSFCRGSPGSTTIVRGPRSSSVLGNVVMPTTGGARAARGSRRRPRATGARQHLHAVALHAEHEARRRDEDVELVRHPAAGGVRRRRPRRSPCPRAL